jgi:hypothetical protein
MGLWQAGIAPDNPYCLSLEERGTGTQCAGESLNSLMTAEDVGAKSAIGTRLWQSTSAC